MKSSDPYSMPLLIPAPPFSLEQAYMAAKLVEVAYQQQKQWQEQGRPREPGSFAWRRPEEEGVRFSAVIWSVLDKPLLSSASEPFGFLAEWEGGEGGRAWVLALRGTGTPPNAISNLGVKQREVGFAEGHGRAHSGYLDLYDSLRASLAGALREKPMGERMIVAGHSLGAALSTFAVADLVANGVASPPSLIHYTLASVRVGDLAFAAAYEGHGVPTYRIVNTCDLVPTLPPPVLGADLYQHVGQPALFSANYGSTLTNHLSMTCYGYALGHPEQPRRPDGGPDGA